MYTKKVQIFDLYIWMVKREILTPFWKTWKKITISKVKELPSILYSCTNAEVLELVNTAIDRLPAELNSLPNLKTIYIHNNRPTKRLTLSENNTITSLYVRGENPSKFPNWCSSISQWFGPLLYFLVSWFKKGPPTAVTLFMIQYYYYVAIRTWW